MVKRLAVRPGRFVQLLATKAGESGLGDSPSPHAFGESVGVGIAVAPGSVQHIALLVSTLPVPLLLVHSLLVNPAVSYDSHAFGGGVGEDPVAGLQLKPD